MPRCKNDPERYYKGTEPSPKGLGFCAHASKLHESRKGKDGKYYIVKQDKLGRKSWKIDNERNKKELGRPKIVMRKSPVPARKRKQSFPGKAVGTKTRITKAEQERILKITRSIRESLMGPKVRGEYPHMVSKKHAQSFRNKITKQLKALEATEQNVVKSKIFRSVLAQVDSFISMSHA